MVMTDKSIIIKDSLFDPLSKDQNIVYYFKGADNKIRYKVWISLDGRDTFYIDHATYRLHRTFSDPMRRVKRTFVNPNCSLAIWTWGVFELGIGIVLKTGEIITTSHYLSYDRELKREGLKFIEVNEVSPWKLT